MDEDFIIVINSIKTSSDGIAAEVASGNCTTSAPATV
jgi:hypothetical protein